jgi:hypothetical protein
MHCSCGLGARTRTDTAFGQARTVSSDLALAAQGDVRPQQMARDVCRPDSAAGKRRALGFAASHSPGSLRWVSVFQVPRTGDERPAQANEVTYAHGVSSEIVNPRQMLLDRELDLNAALHARRLKNL